LGLGSYKLVFYDITHQDDPDDPTLGYLGEQSFDAGSIVHIDPIEVGKNTKKFGAQQSNRVSFSFTCAFPEPDATYSIDIVEKGDPDNVLHTVYAEDLLFIDSWMSNSQSNRITQIETHFTYDQGTGYYNLKNSNAGALKYHIIVDTLGPETILEIKLPLAEFHYVDPFNQGFEPGFDLHSENPVRAYTDYTRTNEIENLDWNYNPTTRIITVALDTSSGLNPLVEVKLDYAVEHDDGWVFDTDPSEYLQELPILASYKYYDEWLMREMTARAITQFRAVGIW
jgi:hypothetical protein